MIAVGVDRPVGKDDVRLLGFENLMDLTVPSARDLDVPIDLLDKDRPSLEDVACRLCLGGADLCRLLVGFARDAGLGTDESILVAIEGIPTVTERGRVRRAGGETIEAILDRLGLEMGRRTT